jgi:plastocyanin
MRSRTLLAVLLVALVVLAPARAATFNVSITKGGFVPEALTIAVGDTVTWRNDDTTSHQVASKGADFTSSLIKPGETFSFTYKNAGRFSYQDETVKKNHGSVTVQGSPTAAISVTAVASKALVVYGGTVTLSGATSSKRAGETVTILAQPLGSAALVAIGSVTTEGGGSWSFIVRPKLETVYGARWKPAATATSSPVKVQVRPQLLFRVKAASGRTVTFFTKARAARSLAGKVLYLQRRNAFGQWVILRKATLTATSAVTFKARLPAGRSRVRMFMPKAQAGAGYLAGISRTLVLVR